MTDPNPPKKTSSWWEVVRFAITVIIIVVPIRMFVAKPFIVSGASMKPTFEDKEYLIVDELSYLLREPARGEVVIFKYPQDPSKYFIKRIIGLPGETVTVRDDLVTIKNAAGDLALTEPYAVQTSDDDWRPETTLTLGPNDYFVMGDNRAVSHDSRAWGALPEKLIAGRALVRLYPFGRVGFWPGAYNNL